jgi:hypothetical protein
MSLLPTMTWLNISILSLSEPQAPPLLPCRRNTVDALGSLDEVII